MVKQMSSYGCGYYEWGDYAMAMMAVADLKQIFN